MTEPVFDFHIHTRASDGAFTAQEVLQKARQAGICGISITDHDTLDAHGDLAESDFAGASRPGASATDGSGAGASKAGPRVLRGVELSTRLGEEEAHILGYFPLGFSPAFREYVESILKCRRDRMAEGIVKLRERGIDITLGDCERLATGRVVSRSIIAEALVQKRYIGRAHRAYPDYVGPAVVPLPDESARGAVERIRSLGGVSVWAHPGARQIDAHLAELRDAGLEGVEVLIPRRRKGERQELLAKTRALGLLVTGGSDWHGRPGGPELGSFRIERGSVVDLLERIGWAENSKSSTDASEPRSAPG